MNCYSNTEKDFALSKSFSKSSDAFSEQNKFEIALAIQNAHKSVFDKIQDIEKRIYLKDLAKGRSFDGIPTYKELYADKLNISEKEIANFLDKNPTLLSQSMADESEKRKIVENYLYQTKIQEEIKEKLSGFKSSASKDPFFAPCPPRNKIPEGHGVPIKIDSDDTNIDIFINPTNIHSRKSWRQIANATENAENISLRFHIVGGKSLDDDTNLEVTLECLISEGEVPWQLVTDYVFQAPISANLDNYKIINDELIKLRIPNEPGYKKCLIDNSKSNAEKITYKASLSNAFKDQVKYDSLIFINGRLFVQFESGDNPYAFQKYIELIK